MNLTVNSEGWSGTKPKAIDRGSRNSLFLRSHTTKRIKRPGSPAAMKPLPSVADFPARDKMDSLVATYPITLPALPPIDDVLKPTPAVVAGTALNMDDLSQALQDAADRELLSPPALAQARVRANALEGVFVDAIYRGSTVSQDNSHATILETIKTNHEKTQTAIDASQTAIQTASRELFQAMNARQDAVTWNESAARHNRQCGRMEWRTLRKVNEGPGAFLLPRPVRLPADLRQLSVNEPVPPQFFPASATALETWTHDQISILSMLLNETFGIQDDDTLSTRRAKVHTFLAHY